MKVFETYRRGIRKVSLMVMGMYMLTVMLGLKFTIAKNLWYVMIFFAIIATIMQIITCVKNLAHESTCNGSNIAMQGLLLWGFVFVMSLFMF